MHWQSISQHHLTRPRCSGLGKPNAEE
uniref:Uncharacterized protein n=1 Tax=Arundo donax TaxID=35708 RepID=A0A0A8XS66_ARUDO